MDQPQPQPQPPPSDQQPQQPPPPTLTNPRFTLELEFVSSLANPYYLSHLAVTYPQLLGISNANDEGDATKDTSDPEAQAFAAYLAYLYSYWKTPEYAQFLTHPGATLRALRLLQEDTFRRDIIRPQVIEGLAGTGVNTEEGGITAEQQEGEQDKTEEDQGKQEDGGNQTLKT
ncbi:mediator of RNA polymerase II transcription subunit 31 [Aspergillus leporis]|jgi:mediator of RNA polymerase II transcription subunit 31|uniref:Mediator of RNA polymerase II transcription subunit 31 n=1 Tax=Aspergillus leporis TaxID=41062 RepID=A0A5N5WWF1_9EURO|nr:mediator of RNA polymerase II transcription subunit 31 [Aspergillus leporis]